MLGADIDAWDVPALRVRAAAIVMVVAVSAGLPLSSHAELSM